MVIINRSYINIAVLLIATPLQNVIDPPWFLLSCKNTKVVKN